MYIENCVRTSRTRRCRNYPDLTLSVCAQGARVSSVRLGIARKSRPCSEKILQIRRIDLHSPGARGSGGGGHARKVITCRSGERILRAQLRTSTSPTRPPHAAYRRTTHTHPYFKLHTHTHHDTTRRTLAHTYVDDFHLEVFGRSHRIAGVISKGARVIQR